MVVVVRSSVVLRLVGIEWLKNSQLVNFASTKFQVAHENVVNAEAFNDGRKFFQRAKQY